MPLRTSSAIPAPEPRVARFERLAYGMFIHYGLYSQLGQGEWILHSGPVDPAEYEKLTETFTAEDFDGRSLAKFAKSVGMRYITLTTRHHDGFSLYDTKGLSDYDATRSAAGRDLVADFVEGCRAEGIVPFFYHTTLDWRHKTLQMDQHAFDEYFQYLKASVEILCTEYGPIGGYWFDGLWSRPDIDWREDELYGMIRERQPEAMIINNTGLDARGALGHPEIDSTTFERGLPQAPDRRGWPKYVAGEMCHTLNHHWGFARNDLNYISSAEAIETLALCRKAGANLLLNVGPEPNGALPDYEKALLRKVGQWVDMQGDIIYEGQTGPWRAQGKDFLLEADGKLYWFVFDIWARGDIHVVLPGQGSGPRTVTGIDRPIEHVRWIDNDESLHFVQNIDKGFATVHFTGQPYGTNWVVRVAELSFAPSLERK